MTRSWHSETPQTPRKSSLHGLCAMDRTVKGTEVVLRRCRKREGGGRRKKE